MSKKLNFIQILSVIILGLFISAVFFYPKPAQYAYGAGVCPASWYGQEISAQAYEYDPDFRDGCRPCYTTGYVKCDNSGNLSYRTITSYSGYRIAIGDKQPLTDTSGYIIVGNKQPSPIITCKVLLEGFTTRNQDSGYISSAGSINTSYGNYPQMKVLYASQFSLFGWKGGVYDENIVSLIGFKFDLGDCNKEDWTYGQYTADGYLSFNVNSGVLNVRNFHRDGSNFTQSVAFVNNPVPPLPLALGTINILTNNASSSWTIAGPETITGSGTSATYANKPVGAYTIVWNNVAGYITPSVDSQTLADGGTINFTGNYQLISPPPPPPPPEPTSTPSGKLKEIVPK